MDATEALYQLARQEGIEVNRRELPATGSMSLETEDGRYYIGLDRQLRGRAERVHLGHELGHCLTGSFYQRCATGLERRRQENRAQKWAIRKLIPLEALDEAIAVGHTELWDLAEHFGVTEAFMKEAVCLYTHGNLAAELYF